MPATPTSEPGVRSACEEALEQANAHLVEQEKFAILGALMPGMAHDINTPIGIAITAASGIEEFAHRLQDKLGTERVSRSELVGLADQMANACSLVTANLARAAELIGSLKLVAVDQVSEAEMSVDLAEYLRGIVRIHYPALRSGRVSVDVHAPERLDTRLVPGMFSQIVSNLIMNALAHAFEGEPDDADRSVRIELKTEGEHITLRIADNGRGVTPEVREHMFEPLFTTRRGRGGSGLGLHIVQSLAQRMRGSVSVEASDGPGLSLRVALPYQP